MGVKLAFSYEGKKSDGRYKVQKYLQLNLQWRKQQQATENYVRQSFIIYTTQ